jgi:hypothetical protein
MCFTPTVSITTAIIEFTVATIIILFFRKSSIERSMAIFIYLLGFYQLTEFMICITNYSFLWAKLGFITYTLLPSIGLLFALEYTKRRVNYFAVFVIPLIFSLIALFSKFIISTSCGNYFVTVKSLLYNPSNYVSGIIYFVWYVSMIMIICCLLFIHYRKSKKKLQRFIDIDVIFVSLTSLIPAIILFFILPMLRIQFPSIYCKFSAIFTIGAIILVYLDYKNKRN